MQTPVGKGAVVTRLMRVALRDWMVPDFGLADSAGLAEARRESLARARAARLAQRTRRAGRPRRKAASPEAL